MAIGKLKINYKTQT